MKPPSEQIDIQKLVARPPDGIVRHLKLRAAADKLLTRTRLFLSDHKPETRTASQREVLHRRLMLSAILEVEKCLNR